MRETTALSAGTRTATQDGIVLNLASDGGVFTTNGSGLGVASDGDVSQNRLGGNGEAITMSFATPVKLLQSVVFETGNSTDTVSIFGADDNLLTSFEVGGPGNSSFTQPFAGFTGNVFRFESTANGTGGDPGIRLSSVTVSAVPVPAAFPLLALGLGGLALLGRRRRSAHI